EDSLISLLNTYDVYKKEYAKLVDAAKKAQEQVQKQKNEQEDKKEDKMNYEYNRFIIKRKDFEEKLLPYLLNAEQKVLNEFNRKENSNDVNNSLNKVRKEN